MLVYNRSVSKSEKLQKELGDNKIRIAESPAQLVLESDIVITNLGNDDVVRQIYIQMVDALQVRRALLIQANYVDSFLLQQNKPTKGKIFVETSTIYPSLAGELDTLVSRVALAHLITSPVFGAPAAAEKAQLIIVMSGSTCSHNDVIQSSTVLR